MSTGPITSPDNPIVKHFVKLRTSKTYREENQSVVVIGKRMIDELTPVIPIKKLIIGQFASLIHGSLQTKMTRVSQKLLKKITGVISPDGYIAEFALPAYSPLISLGSILILDQIQDPGNVGTLLRSALAFGFDGVYFIEGTSDPFNDKALRAAKGATFHIPLGKGSWCDFFEKVQAHSPYTLYRADLDGLDLKKVKIEKPFALIVGNEGNGISPIAKAASTPLTIPMSTKSESLNVAVAGSVCMFVMKGYS
jgi:TrmH family RNA methyltransferase